VLGEGDSGDLGASSGRAVAAVVVLVGGHNGLVDDHMLAAQRNHRAERHRDHSNCPVGHSWSYHRGGPSDANESYSHGIVGYDLDSARHLPARSVAEEAGHTGRTWFSMPNLAGSQHQI